MEISSARNRATYSGFTPRFQFLGIILLVATFGHACAQPPAGNPAVPDPVLERFAVSLSAVEALEAFASGDLTSERYVALLLRRIEAYPEINAFVHLDPGQVLAAARDADVQRAAGETLGPLHGLPIAVKDSINTAEMPTTGGTPALAGFQPAANAAVLQILIDAGAIVLGKTNLHELSSGYTTSNVFTGPTRNPYDFDRTPGGSSGGNGAALAARFAPVALGEDTAGSTRVPAALTATMGFRPSSGRYSQAGVVPISSTLDTLGPMARTVEDLALLDAVISGEPQGLEVIALSDLRIGVPEFHFQALLDPEVEKAFGKVLERLEEAGATLVHADIPLVGEDTLTASLVLNLYESVETISAYLLEQATGVTLAQLADQVASPDVKSFLDLALLPFVSEPEYLAVKFGLLPVLQSLYLDYFSGNQVDIVLYPSNITPATLIGQEFVTVQGQNFSVFDAYFRLGHYTPLVGAPTLSLPMGQLPSGLPVGGIDLAGAPGEDRRVLAIGQAVVQVLPRIRPPKNIKPKPLGN